MSLDNKPLQYSVYKGVSGKFGALQFNLQKPHYYKDKSKDFTGALALDNFGKLKEGWKQREGAVFIEATSSTGKNVYDWENKVIFACSVTDMGKVVSALRMGTALDLMHDPGASTDTKGAIIKHVNLFTKEGYLKAGAMVTVTEQNGQEKKEHKIPLTADECHVILELFGTAISRALGW